MTCNMKKKKHTYIHKKNLHLFHVLNQYIIQSSRTYDKKYDNDDDNDACNNINL